MRLAFFIFRIAAFILHYGTLMPESRYSFIIFLLILTMQGAQGCVSYWRPHSLSFSMSVQLWIVWAVRGFHESDIYLHVGSPSTNDVRGKGY